MTNRILLFVYFVVSLLFVLGILLTFYDYNYLGYYSDKIINGLWLGFTLIIIFKFWTKKLVKIFFFTLVSVVLLSILPMAIPFFGIVNYFTNSGDYQQIQLNSNYRIERTRHHPLSKERIYVYEKKGLLEKNICRPGYSQIAERVLNINTFDNLITTDSLVIKNAKLIGVNNEEIEIEYQILDKKASVKHKLNTNDGY
ncbi:hypothetical protein [Psychroserpens sp. NJDZ02]|uniref:hypothetical protein n=1 Tax=Psychroserpens sp. NJDZ02 TaxID=2570561 RepID=UPI0010A89490|nr:hypothetical protein [Psychroserpens sp. NJDZ02]QCE42287.1 hypothetical protein E9099_13030 [Psychroserpens sp. NJDZ02]